MKKILLVLVVVIILTGCTQAFTFRNTSWGMKRADVIKSENAEPTDSDKTFIAYSAIEANGLRADLIYNFTNKDQLCQSTYRYIIDHKDPSDTITDYSNLKKQLTEKYGKPKTDALSWNNERFKDDPFKYPEAMAAGDLVFSTTWNLPFNHTAIRLALFSKDNHTMLIADYYNKLAIKNIEESSNANGL